MLVGVLILPACVQIFDQEALRVRDTLEKAVTKQLESTFGCQVTEMLSNVCSFAEEQLNKLRVRSEVFHVAARAAAAVVLEWLRKQAGGSFNHLASPLQDLVHNSISPIDAFVRTGTRARSLDLGQAADEKAESPAV